MMKVAYFLGHSVYVTVRYFYNIRMLWLMNVE